jgi:hypothetical protein
MVSLGMLSLDETKLAGNAAQAANHTLPQIKKILAEAAETDAAEDARYGDAAEAPTPRTLARRAERRERLARTRDRLAAEDRARRGAQRAKVEAWKAAAAAGKPRGLRPAGEPRTNRNNTKPRANITDPDVRVMRNQKGYVAGYNGQLIVTCQQVIVGAMLSQPPVDRTLLHPLLDTRRQQLTEAGIRPQLRTVLADAGYASEDNFTRAEQQKLRLLVPLRKDPSVHSNPPRKARDDHPARHRSSRPTDAPPPRQGRLLAARPHCGTNVRPGQDLPEDDHHVPPRLQRLQQRMARRHRPQPTQAAHEPPQLLTADRPASADQHRRPSPTTADLPDPGPPRPFVRQAQVCKNGLGDAAFQHGREARSQHARAV